MSNVESTEATDPASWAERHAAAHAGLAAKAKKATKKAAPKKADDEPREG